jgi:hypothetical protein
MASFPADIKWLCFKIENKDEVLYSFDTDKDGKALKASFPYHKVSRHHGVIWASESINMIKPIEL